jgi:acetylornithine/N-succinyldiaminopimelate aminotransferase
VQNEQEAHLIEVARNVLTQNYRQQPVVLRRGEGCRVFSVSGDRYLDLTGGIAACPLGHAHPALVRAIAEQAGELVHISNLFFNEPQIRLAEKLAERAHAMGPVRAFFCNSGAEANEAAIKLAKRYQHVVRGRPERIEVMSFEGSFHGRSIATVALTGQEKYRAGFGPLVEWVRVLPFPDRDPSQVLSAISDRSCAVILETIQAEGGIRPFSREFLRALRERCTETGTLLIFDEVQTGVGRTGTFFGYEATGVVPDLVSLAKGLAGGVPIGCMLARDEVARGFEPGTHASTFGGNPLATAAALTVLAVLDREKLLDRVVALGQHLERKLRALVTKHAPFTTSVRGTGLLQGVALSGEAAPVVARAREKRVLLSVAGGTVVRFAPPFLVTEAELDEGVGALDQALQER